MTRIVPFLTILLWANQAKAEAGVDDQAHLFSAEAIAAAERSIAFTLETTGWQVLVVTVDSLAGPEKENAGEAMIAAAFSGATLDGLGIVLSKQDHRVLVLASAGAEKAFDAAGRKKIRDSLLIFLENHTFDETLAEAMVVTRREARAHSRKPPIFGVRDRARMFPEDAVARADEVLSRVHGENDWDVMIETVESLAGRPLREAAEAAKQAAKLQGVFVFVSRADRRTQILVDHREVNLFPDERIEHLRKTLDDNLKVHQPTKGLLALVNKLQALTSLHAVELQRNQDLALAARAGRYPHPGLDATNPAHGNASGTSGASPDAMSPKPKSSASGTTGNGPLCLMVGLGGLTILWFLSQAFRRTASPPPANSE